MFIYQSYEKTTGCVILKSIFTSLSCLDRRLGPSKLAHNVQIMIIIIMIIIIIIVVVFINNDNDDNENYRKDLQFAIIREN